MENFDASTPQLKAFKKWLDIVASLDLSKVDPLLTRNFKYRSFPEIIEVPEQTKEVYIQWFGGTMVSMTKIEVRIQRRRTSSQTDIYPSPPFTKRLKHRGN
jgi:hypothetical protein